MIQVKGKQHVLSGVILDLDGTVYLGSEQVPGASEFVSFLAKSGIQCLFVTNRSNRKPEDVAAHLQEYGIPCGVEHVLTSSQAAVQYLKHGSAYVIGEEGLTSELTKAGIAITDHAPDYVIVSLDRQFNYEKLQIASNLIAGGATFIATNPDKVLKVSTGLNPGTGSIVAAVEAASGVKPLVIGKPEKLIMEMSLARMGLSAAEVIAVGDNVLTDIPAGAAAGMKTVLLLTGVSKRHEAATGPYQPDWVLENFAELTNLVRELGHSA
jgi:4-nitrophenyl phosphatase